LPQPNANGDTYGYAYGVTDSNAYGDANADTNADSNCDANADGRGNCDADADVRAGRHTWAVGYRRARASCSVSRRWHHRWNVHVCVRRWQFHGWLL
jgi:hypothetical protein